MDRVSETVSNVTARDFLDDMDSFTYRAVRLRMVSPCPFLFKFSWGKLKGRLRQGLDQRLAQTNTIGYSVSLSRGAGLCIAFDTALILLPMLRTIITTIYPKFTLLPLDENIWFHRQVSPPPLLPPGYFVGVDVRWHIRYYSSQLSMSLVFTSTSTASRN